MEHTTMCKFLTRLTAFTLLALLLVPTMAFAQSSATDPLSVYNAYIAAYNKGDVDQAVGFFADNATAKVTPAPPNLGSFSGKDQLRTWTQAAVASHSNLQPVGSYTVTGDKVSGIMRLTSDDWKKRGLDHLDSNFEATVTNGKITTLNLSGTPETLANLAKLGTPPAGAGTGAGTSGNVPAGAPATGAGGGATNVSADNAFLAWLIGLIVCGGLVGFIGFRLASRNRKA